MKYGRLLLGLIVAITFVVILGVILSPLLLRPPSGVPEPRPPDGNDLLALLTTVKTIVSMVNIVLILTLLGLYYRIYLEMKSRFTLGLVLLILVLLLYAITSNPLIHILFGYYPLGLGPFTVMPDIFAAIALFVLLYLTLE